MLPSAARRPTWAWDFTRGGIPSGAAFARASGGTYFDASGILQTAGNNVVRFDRDPLTKAPLGYLAEQASTNSLVRSEALDNAAWTKNRVTISADATTAPDGNLTADKVLETIDNDTHQMYSNAMTVVANAAFGASIFVKAAENTAVTVVAFGGSGAVWFGCTLNLSAGTVSKTGNGASGTLTSATIRAVGNGWYRVALIGSLNDTSASLGVWMVNTTNPNYGSYGVTSYIGNTSNGLYAWGGQLEAGGVGITSYIPTSNATASRAADVLSMPLASLPGWNPTKGGVLVAASRPYTLGGSPVVAALSDSAFNNAIAIYSQYGSGPWSADYYGGGSRQTRPNSGVSPVAFARWKLAVGWSATRMQLARGGNLDSVVSGNYVLPNAPTNLYAGSWVNGSQLNGAVESVAYYAGARPDAFVQQVSR